MSKVNLWMKRCTQICTKVIYRLGSGSYGWEHWTLSNTCIEIEDVNKGTTNGKASNVTLYPKKLL